MNVTDHEEKSSLLKESLLVRVRNTQNQGNTAGSNLPVNTAVFSTKETSSNSCFYFVLVSSTLIWIFILISIWTKY